MGRNERLTAKEPFQIRKHLHSGNCLMIIMIMINSHLTIDLLIHRNIRYRRKQLLVEMEIYLEDIVHYSKYNYYLDNHILK